MGPPWGAFCQITLTSCSTSLTIAEWGILGDLLAFLYRQRQIFMKLGEMIDADKVMKPQHSGRDPANVWIWINVAIRIWIPDHVLYEILLVGGGLLSLNTVQLFMLCAVVVQTTSTLLRVPAMVLFISGKLLRQNFTVFSKTTGINLFNSLLYQILGDAVSYTVTEITRLLYTLLLASYLW